MQINSVGGALVAPQKTKNTAQPNSPDQQSQVKAVAVPVYPKVVSADAQANINRDLPEPSQNKAVNAYTAVASAEKKETLTALLGIDVYA